MTGWDLTAAQIACLRESADFQAVIDFFHSYDPDRFPLTDQGIRGMMTEWSSYPAFQAEYGTIENYLEHVGCLGGGNGGNGGTTPPFDYKWLIIGGLGLLLVTQMVKKKR